MHASARKKEGLLGTGRKQRPVRRVKANSAASTHNETGVIANLPVITARDIKLFYEL